MAGARQARFPALREERRQRGARRAAGEGSKQARQEEPSGRVRRGEHRRSSSRRSGRDEAEDDKPAAERTAAATGAAESSTVAGASTTATAATAATATNATSTTAAGSIAKDHSTPAVSTERPVTAGSTAQGSRRGRRRRLRAGEDQDEGDDLSEWVDDGWEAEWESDYAFDDVRGGRDDGEDDDDYGLDDGYGDFSDDDDDDEFLYRRRPEPPRRQARPRYRSQSLARRSSRPLSRRAAWGRWEAENEAPRAASAGSRTAFVTKKLSRLEQRVEERLAQLEEEDQELEERRAAARAELRKLRAHIDESGEIAIPDDVAVETRGPRQRSQNLMALCEELYSQRLGVWAALDEAEARLEEISSARRMLARRGLLGLRRLVETRAVSRNLRTFLQRLL